MGRVDQIPTSECPPYISLVEVKTKFFVCQQSGCSLVLSVYGKMANNRYKMLKYKALKQMYQNVPQLLIMMYII